MPRTTLYLHIGTPKTGTSAIQDFLEANTKQLEKEGFIFPDFHVRYYKVRAGRNGRWLRCMETEEERLTWNKNFDTIAAAAADHRGIILTDESLWTWSHDNEEGIISFWKKISDKFKKLNIDLKVIVYLRRQDQFIYSFWGQKVKSAEKRTFKDYMEAVGESRLHLDYYRQLERIASVIGRENIIVASYDRSRWTGQITLQSEFLSLCGVKVDESYQYPEGTANPSLSDIVLEAKRLLNRRPEFCDRMNYSNRYLKIAQKRLKKEGKLKNRTEFTNDDRKAFLLNYDASNEAVAREYLHQDAPLFDLTDLEKPSERAVYSSEELADAYGIMIDAMHKELLKKQDVIKEQTNQIKVLKSQRPLPEKAARKLYHLVKNAKKPAK